MPDPYAIGEMRLTAARLLKLLDDPHPGLASWHLAVGNVLRQLPPAPLPAAPHPQENETMKPITKELREGLEAVWDLASADVQGEEERWPANHPIHAALAYIRSLAQGGTT